jgi:hypothetical protein
MWVLSVLGPLLPAVMIGCSQVRLLENTPDGGVITIPNNSNQWPTYYRNRAEFLMNRKFPEGYVIVSEQTTVGNPAVNDGRKPNEDFDYNGAYDKVTHYDRKEYHITFRRAAAKGALPSSGQAPKAKPRAPAKDDSKDELPSPRPVPIEPQRTKRAGNVSDGG